MILEKEYLGAKEKMKHGMLLYNGYYLQLSKRIVTLLLTWSLLSAHGYELVDAVRHCPVDTKVQRWKRDVGGSKGGQTKLSLFEEREECLYRAAAASWFLRLGELGSVDSALAASSSLLDDIEMVFRLETTCVWSSLD